MVIFLLLVQTLLDLTVGEYPLICPGKSHWNLRASTVCRKIDDYRCLWDVNYHVFVEQCEGYYAQFKGYRKVIEGDINEGDCSPNTYQPREWTTEKNFDCEFEKSSCNELGQIVYDDGDSLSDRSCRCDYTAGYVFLQKPKHLCYCVPSEEDCTCVPKRCPLGHELDPEYECRPSNKWQILFRCPELPYGASSTVSPEEEIVTITKDTEKLFPNKCKAVIALAVVIVLSIGIGVGFLNKDSVFKKRLSDTTVYEGEMAIFSCELEDENMEITWFINDKEVSPENQSNRVNSNGHSRELEINDVKRSDDGIKITARVGCEKTSATLAVKASLFSTGITNKSVRKGDSAVFRCKVQNETDTVQWLVNGNAISNNGRYTETKEGPSRELKIDKCTLEDNEMVISVNIRGIQKRTAQLFIVESFTGTDRNTLERNQIKHKLTSTQIQELTECSIIDDEFNEKLQSKKNEFLELGDNIQFKTNSRIRCSKCFFVVKNIFPCVLSKILDSSGHSSQDMYNKIHRDKYLSSKILTSKENSTLQSLLTHGYNELNFPLMFKIIKYYKIIPTPFMGWDSEPGNKDTEIEDDVQRLKIIRRNIMTRMNADVSETEFDDFFSRITVICNRVDSYLNNANYFTKEVEDAKLHPFDGSEVLSFMFDYEHLKELFTLKIGDCEFKFYDHPSMTDLKNQISQESTDLEQKKTQPITLTINLEIHPKDIDRLKKHCDEEINKMLEGIKVVNIRQGSVIIDILITEALLNSNDRLQTELKSLLSFLSNECAGAQSCVTVVMTVSEALYEDENWFGHIHDEEFTKGLTHIDLEVNTDVVQAEESLQVELTNLFNQVVSVSNGDQLFPTDRPVVSIVHSTATTLPWKRKLNDITVYEGDTVTLSCEVTDEDLEVFWFVNDVPINSDDQYEVRSEGCVRHLLIAEAKLGDKDLKITAKVGDQMATAKVVVKALPWKRKLKDATVYEGEGVTLSCEVIDENLEVVWFLNDVPISSGDQYGVRSKGCDRHLLIRKAKLSDTDMEVTAKVGDQMTTAKVVVKVPPAVAKGDIYSSLKSKLTSNTIYVNLLTQEWVNTPLPGNVSKDDDVERLWYCKNIMAHNIDFKIQYGDFNTTYDDMYECLKRLGGNQLTSDINLKTKSMDSITKTDVIGNIKNFIEDAEVQKIKERLDNPIPSNIQEQSKTMVDRWITDDEMFVPTQAAEEVMTQIKNHYFVVVTGRSGTGKTYTVRHTALLMEKEGYVIVPAVVPGDISKYFKHGCKTVFVFDDLCGRFTLNQNYLDQWKLYKQNLKTILKDESCKILASCRLQVSKDIKMKEYMSEIQIYECKIGTGSLSLSIDERKKIIEKYFGPNKITTTDEKLCEYEFLPFLCSVLRNKSISELEKCFQNPFLFFREELEKLYQESDEGKLKYCALLLCVLYNNKLTQNSFERKDELLKSMLSNVLDECELPSTIPLSRIQKTLQSLQDVFISITNDRYMIIHDKLFDYIAKYFGEKMIDIFIKFADSNFISERFCIEGRETSRHTADCISVPDDKLQHFIERLIADWTNGEVQNVLCNTNMKSVHFRQKLLSYFKELDDTTQKELVQKRDDAHGDTPLSKICMYGDLEFTRCLLRLGADVNLGCKNKSTPLNIACLHNYVEIVKILLKSEQIDIDHRDINGRTALFLSCKQGNAEIVNELIRHEADFNISDNNQATPFFIASINGHFEVVSILMKYNVDVNKGIHTGFSPLMAACFYDHLEVVKKLLNCEQIKVNNSARNGITALHVACVKGNLEIVTELIQQTVDINRCTDGGLTALMIACMCSHLEVVSGLLNCKQIDVSDNTNDGLTVLFSAFVTGDVKKGTEHIQRKVNIDMLEMCGFTQFSFPCNINHLEVVKELLKCTQIDVTHSAKDGWTAIHLACIAGNAKIVFELTKCNADINGSEKDGWTPLMLALKYNHLQVVEVLMQCKNIDVYHSANNGITAFHVACMAGNEEFVTKLKQHADINMRKEGGWTPLMLACFNNQIHVVKILLNCKQIEVNHSTTSADTALHLACMQGNVEIVTELLQHDINKNSCNVIGMTPLMYACIFSDLDSALEILKNEQTDVGDSTNDSLIALLSICVTGNVKKVTEFMQSNVDIDMTEMGGFSLQNNHLEVVQVLLKSENIDINHCSNDGNTALHFASMIGNVQIVTELLQNNVDINRITINGWTPLMVACYFNHIKVVCLLLECEQIDVNHSSIDGWTALHVACEKGNVGIISELILGKADINRQMMDGLTPLMLSCVKNHIEAVKVLLRCEQLDVNHSVDQGETALYLACQRGNAGMVSEFIKNNANINVARKDGVTPLMVSCFENHLDVVKVLLKCKQIDVDHSADQGHTALHVACEKGNENIVTELIQCNTDINRRTKNGSTPLMAACANNHLEVVKVLLRCEHIDVNNKNDDGITALYLTCQKGNAGIVTELIKHNVDVNSVRKDGVTPLMVSCFNNHLDVVKVILNCEQIDVNQSKDDGTTALYLACQEGNAAIITELLKNNVDINSCRKDGVTPLMVSCLNNHLDVVKVLLKCKQIDVDHSADQGHTALHVACEKGNENIVTELIQCNTDINRRTKNGSTPLMTACAKNHLEVVKVLLRCEHIDVNNKNDDGITALYLACQKGNAGIVIELIKHNVDINMARKDGVTPLMGSCFNNHLDVVKVLLKCEQIEVDRSGYQGQTALHVACQKGNEKIVTEFIQSNTDINHRDEIGLTPLLLACLNNHLEVVKVLLNFDQIDIDRCTYNGCSSLYLACQEGNIDIVKLLIKHKVDVNRGVDENRPKALVECIEHHTPELRKFLNSENTGQTDHTELFKQISVIWFCQTVHTKVVMELAKNPRDVETCKMDVCFPLEVACSFNRIDVVKELLKCPDIEINRCTSYGQTALYWACIHGQVDSMAVLLAHNADVNISDINGISPLHIACWASNKEAVKLLMEHGANKTLKDINGKTPVDIAVEENDQECLSILNQS